MMAVTIFVLFGDDIRILLCPSSYDDAFGFLNSVAFFLFLIELILNSWAKSDFSDGVFRVKGYMFSFFFWLDLLAIFSMLPDLTWIYLLSGFHSHEFFRVVGRARKLGAKAAHVIRMARLVRLVKLYKFTSQRLREKKMINDLTHLVKDGHMDQNGIDEYVSKFADRCQSKVGAELSDFITRIVIIAVLLMLCVVPLLTYSNSDDNENDATVFLQEVNVDSALGHKNASINNINCEYLLGATTEYKEFMESVARNSDFKNSQDYLISLKVKPPRCGVVDLRNEDLLGSLRATSVRVITTKPVLIHGLEYSVEAIFNLQPLLEEISLAGIYLTLFVIFMLVALSSQFTADAQKLVLAPIESMMDMIHTVADDPLEVIDFTEQ